MRDVDESPKQALQRLESGPKPSLPSVPLPSLSVLAWLILVGVILTAGIVAWIAISNLMQVYYPVN